MNKRIFFFFARNRDLHIFQVFYSLSPLTLTENLTLTLGFV